MERHSPPARHGYRVPSRPDPVPFTVLRVRPGEYAEPAWVRRLLERVAALRRQLRR
ncbi:MAG: hypothetical protein KF729_03385 [Sandaracinaceae bacterium]|nr:hypothetical protein [Sandaracinaceae bacterium]